MSQESFEYASILRQIVVRAPFSTIKPLVPAVHFILYLHWTGLVRVATTIEFVYGHGLLVFNVVFLVLCRCHMRSAY